MKQNIQNSIMDFVAYVSATRDTQEQEMVISISMWWN